MTKLYRYDQDHYKKISTDIAKEMTEIIKNVPKIDIDV